MSLYAGKYPSNILAAFPWSRLQVVSPPGDGAGHR